MLGRGMVLLPHVVTGPGARVPGLDILWFRLVGPEVDFRPWSWRRPLRGAVNVRVIILAGDRIKTHARGNGVCIIVLCGYERGCDRVIAIDCNGST